VPEDSRETLIAQVREVLIRENDQIGKHELYLLFINECNEAKLTEEDFYKFILKPAHKSVDWEAIDKAREEGQRLEQQEAQRQKEHENAVQEAPALIDRLIAVAFEDGIVEAAALEVIFEKARTLSQDTSKLVIRIDAMLHQKGFRSWPRANFDAPTLMAMLLSADWYDAAHFPKPAPAASTVASAAQPPPPVSGTPRIHHFTASKRTVKKGEPVIISWEVSGIREVFIANLGYTSMLNGSHTVSPQQSTTYKLVAGKLEQVINIEVRKPLSFFKILLVTLLVLAGAILAFRFVGNLSEDNSTEQPAVTATENTGTDNYNATTLTDLRNGGGRSGLTDDEARKIAIAVSGYYKALNRQPISYEEIGNYFAFPLTNYYGGRKANREALYKSLAAYYEGVVISWNHQLGATSRFVRKKGGLYHLSIDEVYSYREIKSPDSLVVLDLTETLILDKEYRIVSVNTQKKSTRSKRYLPRNAGNEEQIYDRR
jgi:hypothetical protein